MIAVVVQPGVEFGDAGGLPLRDRKKRAICLNFVGTEWQGVYEAHSTDYQTPAALRQMVRDHFAILKVGPWLTFAFREAVFALAAIEEEWLGNRKELKSPESEKRWTTRCSRIQSIGRIYYRGDDAALRFARKYSLSDRSRYYWTQPSVAEALQRLIENLTLYPAPVSLISQFLPVQARGSAGRRDCERSGCADPQQDSGSYRSLCACVRKMSSAEEAWRLEIREDRETHRS